jgi:hypothetical protein
MAGPSPPLAALYRSLRDQLVLAVTEPLPALVQFRQGVAALVSRLSPTTWVQVLPALCHLLVNRLLDRDQVAAEAAAMVLWQRTLEGISARRGR